MSEYVPADALTALTVFGFEVGAFWARISQLGFVEQSPRPQAIRTSFDTKVQSTLPSRVPETSVR